MQLLLAKTKLDEVLEFFTHPGPKDLKPFGIAAKKKAELRRSLTALSNKDVFDSATGQAFIAVYENNWDLAISNLRTAYNFTNKSTSTSLNLANVLFINGQHEEAINIYIHAMSQSSNDQRLFNEIFQIIIPYHYLDEVNRLIEVTAGIELTANQVHAIEVSKRALLFLEEINVSLEVFRSHRIAAEAIIYKYFTITTKFRDETHRDESRKMYSSFLYLPMTDSEYKANHNLIGQMNDDLLDLIINLKKTKFLNQEDEFRKMSKNISLIFSIDFLEEEAA